MSDDDVAAVIARIKERHPHVHDAAPARPTYPYVVVYASLPRRSSNRAADVRVQETLWFQTTVVGVSVSQCRAAGLRVVDALSDWAPTVPGRVAHKVEHLDSQPVHLDEDLPDRSLFIATDQWRSRSSPVAG